MIEDLEEIINLAITDVFRTMLGSEVEPRPTDAGWLNGESHVAGCVGFIGSLTGVVYIYLTESFSRTITASMVEMDPDDIESDEMVNDAMGEISNMVVGQLKARLCDRGIDCVLTIPSIVRGSHFSIETIKNTERRIMCFETKDGHKLLVETLLKPNQVEA